RGADGLGQNDRLAGARRVDLQRVVEGQEGDAPLTVLLAHRRGVALIVLLQRVVEGGTGREARAQREERQGSSAPGHPSFAGAADASAPAIIASASSARCRTPPGASSETVR